MEDSPKTQKILRAVSCAVLIAYAVVIFGIPLIREGIRLHNINQKDYYVIFDEYNFTLDNYDVYVMVNNKNRDNSERDAIEDLMTDTFVSEMSGVPSRNPMYGNLYERYGRKAIKVHLLLPTEKLDYGWERSYENIVYNMADSGISFSDITDARRALLTVPASASTYADCTVEFELQ